MVVRYGVWVNSIILGLILSLLIGLCPRDVTFISVSYPPSPLLGERAMLKRLE